MSAFDIVFCMVFGPFVLYVTCPFWGSVAIMVYRITHGGK